MTEAQYNQEMHDLLQEVPEAFRPFITTESWDRGHSAGYEDVINEAHSLVNNLMPGIKRYTKELTGR